MQANKISLRCTRIAGAEFAPAFFCAPLPIGRAVLQLLYTGSTPLQWLFPQEKAISNEVGQSISIGEPL
jgi:hypothetical protein